MSFRPQNRRRRHHIVVYEALAKIIRQKKQASGRTRKRAMREKRGKCRKGGQYLHAAGRPEVHSSDEETRSSSGPADRTLHLGQPPLRESRESQETSLWGSSSRQSRRVASCEIPPEPPRSFSLRVFPSAGQKIIPPSRTTKPLTSPREVQKINPN